MALKHISAWVREALPYAPEAEPVLDWFQKVVPFIDGKQGIEIEGYHKFFQTRMPLHTLAKSLDKVNFARDSVYDGCILAEDCEFGAYQLSGRRYLGEVISLSAIANQQYDFVTVADHLQKVANPIKALVEIYRILNEDGVLVWMQPKHKVGRSVTTFDHLLEDYLENVSEQDDTHAEEVMDNFVGENKTEFKKLIDDNLHSRVMQHHVFDLALMEDALGYANFKVETHDESDSETVVVAIKD